MCVVGRQPLYPSWQGAWLSWSQSKRGCLCLNKKYCSARCCVMNTIQRVNGVKMEWSFLVVFYSLLLLSFWAGRLKRSDDLMLVVSVKAQFWKKTDKSIKGRAPWPGADMWVSLSPHLPWVTSSSSDSRGTDWRENGKLGLKFKEPWEQAGCNKSWGVSCLRWVKALEGWVCNEVVLGQFYLHCTPALPSKTAALSLDSRRIFT